MSGIGYGGVVDYAPVTSATATREMAVTGMGDGGVCVGGPALVLNFGVSPTGTTSTLDPRITFSRASNATYFDSTGTLQYAPHNLLTYSEQFDNSVWGATAGTVSANSTTAPDGTTTADTFTESTGSVDPRFPVNTSLVTGNTYALSVYAKVKPNSAQRYLMLVFNAGFAAVSGVNFDLVAGTVGASANATGTIEAIGDGWYRCSMIPSGTATASGSFRIRLSNVNTASNITSPTAYTGDGTSGVYVWGAQLNVGALQPYYSTTVKNQLSYTQEFDNAAWTKTNSFVQTNQIRNNTMQGAVAGTPGTNPTYWVMPGAVSGLTQQIVGTGTENGITYIDVRYSGTTTTAGSHAISFEAANQIAAASGQTWTRSAWFKIVAGSTANLTSLIHNLQGRNAANTAFTETFSTDIAPSLTSTLTRFSTTSTLADPNTAFARSQIAYVYNSGVAIDLTLRIGLPQLVRGAVAGDPTPTYGAARAVVYAAPDGSVTADKLVEDTATSTHIFFNAAAVTANGPSTYSLYVKAAERSWVNIRHTGLSAFFNLATGQIGTVDAGLTASITSVGNGWYRCAVVKAASASGAIGARIATADNTDSYAGDGTSGILIWGAQFSDSASLDAYTYNPVAAPSAAAYYGPRIEYDPATLALRGLLIEEARTNSIRNNTMQGAVAGTPGTLPTNWAFAGNAALSREIVSIGTDNGINYIDLRIFGTVAAVAFPEMNLLFESTSFAAASVSQSWTATNYVKVVGGSLAGILNGELFIIGYNSASGVTEASAAAFDYATLTGPLSAHRLSHTRTLTNASTVFVNSRIDVNFTAGGGTAVDVTLRIGLSQLEQGAFATSVIPTTTIALTRSADVALMQGANFSNWYNAVNGTFYAEYDTSNSAQNNNVLSFSDGTTSNRMTLRASSTSVQSAFAGASGGATQWAITAATALLNTPTKAAGAYATNDIAYVRSNGAVGTDTSAIIPAVNQLRIGTEGDGTLPLNGRIRSFSYYPTRLPNSTLQALTS